MVLRLKAWESRSSPNLTSFPNVYLSIRSQYPPITAMKTIATYEQVFPTSQVRLTAHPVIQSTITDQIITQDDDQLRALPGGCELFRATPGVGPILCRQLAQFHADHGPSDFIGALSVLPSPLPSALCRLVVPDDAHEGSYLAASLSSTSFPLSVILAMMLAFLIWQASMRCGLLTRPSATTRTETIAPVAPRRQSASMLIKSRKKAGQQHETFTTEFRTWIGGLEPCIVRGRRGGADLRGRARPAGGPAAQS